ncbi:Tyrosinase-like protein, partial [Lachnellula willkommii]
MTAVAVAFPATEPRQLTKRDSKCTTVAVRKEWRNLTSSEQTSYLESQKCLFGLPAQLDLLGSTNRWEDLVSLHQNQTDVIHNDGQFLPWHRYFLHVHENVTRSECGYTGPMPWWDERLDAGNFTNAPLFTPELFGSALTNASGLGVGFSPDTTGLCVTDGYFANTTLHLGPGSRANNTVHCLNRNVDEESSLHTNATSVDECNAYDNYEDMWECVFPLGPHGGGHFGVNGDMSNAASSPNDPVFFLHHGFVDRNWWAWQNVNQSVRQYELGGYNTQTEPATGW